MVVVNYSGKEINTKIVYYGPGLCGKTTNLERIYDSVPAANKGKMISMKTKTDRTLFFDFLPLELGDIGGFRTRLMLYTVPGQVFYNATRKLVLKGVDAVVFVADSERGKMKENQASLENLRENLISYGMDVDQIPIVFQYNKRDLPDVYTCEELDRGVDRGSRPMVEAVAAKGDGVFETLRLVSKLLLTRLHHKMRPGAASREAAPRQQAMPVAGAEVAGAETEQAPSAAAPFAATPSFARGPAPAATPPPPSSPAPPAARPFFSPAARPAVREPVAPRPVAPQFVTPQPVPLRPPLEAPRPPFERAAAPSPSPAAQPLEIVRLDTQAPSRPGARRIVVPVEIDLTGLEDGQPFELVLRLEVRRSAAA